MRAVKYGYFMAVLGMVFLPFVADAVGIATYQIGQWSEKLGYGNHRAVVVVAGSPDAVKAVIPWRRHDYPLLTSAVFVTDKQNHKLANVCVIDADSDEGTVVFQPVKGQTEYYIYYMPYQPTGHKFISETYATSIASAAPDWLNRHGLDAPDNRLKAAVGMPEAKLHAIESRGEFNNFYPMEVCATKKEVENLKKQFPHNAALVTFPEPREREIRMRDRLPYCWLQNGPRNSFSGEAEPDEYYPFQIGLYAVARPVKVVKLIFADLINKNGERITADRITCFNLSGSDFQGKHFSQPVIVGCNQVLPLWIGVTVPKDAAGTYRGYLQIVTDCGTFPFDLSLKVSGEKVTRHGDHDLSRLSRLRWLNSKIGLDDVVLPGFKELEYKNSTLVLAGRSVTYQNNGLPASIVSNEIEILAAPISLGTNVNGNTFYLAGTGNQIKEQKKTLMEFSALATLNNLRGTVNSTAEQDGCLQYEIILEVDKATKLDDLFLNIPIKDEVAQYITGMRQQGGRRIKDVAWKWGETNLDTSVWLGEVYAGLQLKLQEEESVWTIWGDSVKPNAWYNNGLGGCTIKNIANQVLIHAYCGPSEITPQHPLRLNFRFMITPFKKINPDHWNWRVSHHNWNTNDRGFSIINMFHSEPQMPYINYPFTHLDDMKKAIKACETRSPNSNLNYYLKDKTDWRTGTVQVKTMVNFDHALRKQRDDNYNHRLFDLDFGSNLGKFIVFWSTDDCGMRACFIKRGRLQNDPPDIIFGKKLESGFGDKLDVCFSWGKELSLYVNGELIGHLPFKYAAHIGQSTNPILQLCGDKFIIQSVRVDAGEHRPIATNTMTSNVFSPILHDEFDHAATLRLPEAGKLDLDIAVKFDPVTRIAKNPWYNRMLAEISFGNAGRMIFYWNVDDHGMRLVVQKGAQSSQEYPLILSSAANWQNNEKHQTTIFWDREIGIAVDGKKLAATPMSNFVRDLLKHPAEIKLFSDGMIIGNMRVSAVNQSVPTVNYTSVTADKFNTTPGGGVFYGQYVLGYNGLMFIKEKLPTRFQLYYTSRELSNHCRELWAFRALGNEIFSSDKGGVYVNDLAYVCGKGGGYPWLQEHLGTDYIPAWRTITLGEDFCAAISTNPTSRLLNYYLEGLKYLLDETRIDGLYLDGIGYGRATMKRVAQTMYQNGGANYRIEFHCSDLYRKDNGSVLNLNMEHLPYLSNVWMGEGFNYNMPPDFYLVEICGLPFGITGDMLNYKNGGNLYRGMIFGIGGRLQPDVKHLWNFWDRADLKNSEMLGYWDKRCPVKTDNPEVYATCYRKKNDSVIAVAHWPEIKSPSPIGKVVVPCLQPEDDLEKFGARMTQLVELGNSNVLLPADMQTTMYAAILTDGLKLSWDAYFSGSKAELETKKNKIWERDSVELFIRPDLKSKWYYQFIGDSKGNYYESRNRDSSWKGQWDYRTTVSEHSWHGDLFIPWKTLGIKPLSKNDQFSLNFARNTTSSVGVWKTMDGDFHQPDKFVVATIGDSPLRQNELRMPPARCFRLKIDFHALGLDPRKTEIIAPAIPGFQKPAVFQPDTAIPIENAKGYLLVLKEKE